MINSRSLDDLNPVVKTLCEKFIASCAKNNIDIVITSTYRDFDAQNALYEQGRTLPGKKVTNARGGDSFHNWRVAFDFVPVVDGKARWDDGALFVQCGEIAEKLGLEWAGRWVKFKEMAHCQFTYGLSLADFKAGKTF
jgi:peptidoglycan L-alanyl-D-glutamate endopeptidase CwlK